MLRKCFLKQSVYLITVLNIRAHEKQYGNIFIIILKWFHMYLRAITFSNTDHIWKKWENTTAVKDLFKMKIMTVSITIFIELTLKTCIHAVAKRATLWTNK